MSCDRHPRCKGCGRWLDWFECHTIAHIDGVPLTGPPLADDDPRLPLIRAATPFCRDCYTERMATAVVVA